MTKIIVKHGCRADLRMGLRYCLNQLISSTNAMASTDRVMKSPCDGMTPPLAINWGIEGPVLSARDAAAPLLSKVEGLPIYGGI
jgi:hypothetical protein